MTMVETQPAPTSQASQRSFWEGLRCPKCAQLLKRSFGDEQYGILACGCARYPLVDGIAILRHAAPGERVNFARAAACIERGHRKAALAWCLGGSVGSPRRRFLGAIERIAPGPLRSLVHRIRGAL